MSHDHDYDENEPQKESVKSTRARLWSVIKSDDLEARAEALLDLANILMDNENSRSEALSHAGAAVDIYKNLERKFEEMMSRQLFGDMLCVSGFHKEALAEYWAARELVEVDFHESEIAGLFFRIGGCELSEGNYKDSFNAYFSAGKLNEELNEPSRAQLSFQNAHMAAGIAKNYDDAELAASAAIRNCKEINAPAALAEAYMRLADTLINLGKFAEAAEAHEKGRSLMLVSDLPWLDATLSFNMARFLANDGLLEESLKHFESALSGAKIKNSPVFSADILFARAKALISLGEFASARNDLECLINVTNDEYTNLDILNVYRVLIVAMELLGDTANLELILQNAIFAASENEDKNSETELTLDLAQYYLECGKTKAGLDVIEGVDRNIYEVGSRQWHHQNFLLANAYLDAGRATEALMVAEEVLSNTGQVSLESSDLENVQVLKTQALIRLGSPLANEGDSGHTEIQTIF